MSTTDMEYIIANRRWLQAKSIMSYVQVGLSALVVIVLATIAFLGAPSIAKEIKGFDGAEAASKLFVTFFGSFAIAMIALFALSIAIYYYTAVQYKKIADATDSLSAKNQLKPSEEAMGEYFKYFKTVGILNLVTWVLGAVIVVFLIGSLFVSLSSSGLLKDGTIKYNSDSSSSSNSINTNYNY